MLRLDLQLDAAPFSLDFKARITHPITGLFGPSGAGKTTLLHLIAGLRRPQRGRIVLHGRTLLDSRARINLPPHRRRVGVVFQDARLLPHRSVLGNLRYGLPPRRLRRLNLDQLVDLLQIAPLLDRLPRTLSGGQQQRVALGRAILAEPELLLLDEPVTGIDPALKSDILPRLRSLQHATDIPMLVVSHDLSDLLAVTDELLMIDRGRPAVQGTLASLLDDPAALARLPEPALVNLLHLHVAEHQPARGITLLHAPAIPAVRPLKAPLQTQLAPGQPIDALLRPRDIALATAPVEFISIQNQLPAVVRRLTAAAGQTYCLLDADWAPTPVLAEITHHAADQLNIHPGQRLWCLWKVQSMALRPANAPHNPSPVRPHPDLAQVGTGFALNTSRAPTPHADCPMTNPQATSHYQTTRSS